MEIQKRLAFSVDEYKGRVARVREEMARRKFDVLLAHTPENICYLSGYHTPGYYMYQVLILPLEKPPLILTRLIEQTNVRGFSWFEDGLGYADTQDPIALTAECLTHMGLAKCRIGLERSCWFLTISQAERLMALLPDATWADGSGIVEVSRAVKSPAEIGYIRQAADIAAKGMQAAADSCRAGATECAVAGQIYRGMVENGGEYAGLPLFISSGHRTLLVHATWTDKVIQPGDSVLVELAGTVMRYAAPLFRTFSIGEPSGQLARASTIVAHMLEMVMEAIRPGATSHGVDAAARRAAAEHGVEGGVRKRAGYSVGLNFPPDWGEGCFLDLKEDDRTVLVPGMVFHVPQSLRLEGSPPAAVSETVLVTPGGREVLTTFPRHLIVVRDREGETAGPRVSPAPAGAGCP